MLLKRTHTCGELTTDDVGKPVVLNGWVDAWRDFGGLVFIDLRDRYGVTQVVFEPDAGAGAPGPRQRAAQRVRHRRQGDGRPAAAPARRTPSSRPAAIEVRVQELVVYNATPTPPFEMHGPEPNEELRLTYRYLDLRRPAMQEIFILRHRLAQLMRHDDVGARLPRGRDARSWAAARPKGPATSWSPAGFIAGHFYALPQSPQIYKQLLMVSGFDRYFQIARCFRDEDLRANRQPEFTQLDVEMSFVDDHDVTSTMEILVAAMAREFTGEELTLPLPRLDYHDVMERFGSDRPDLRYGLELKDVADIAEQTEFKVFQQAKDAGHRIRGICARRAAGRVTAARTSTA